MIVVYGYFVVYDYFELNQMSSLSWYGVIMVKVLSESVVVDRE